MGGEEEIGELVIDGRDHREAILGPSSCWIWTHPFKRRKGSGTAIGEGDGGDNRKISGEKDTRRDPVGGGRSEATQGGDDNKDDFPPAESARWRPLLFYSSLSPRVGDPYLSPPPQSNFQIQNDRFVGYFRVKPSNPPVPQTYAQTVRFKLPRVKMVLPAASRTRGGGRGDLGAGRGSRGAGHDGRGAGPDRGMHLYLVACRRASPGARKTDQKKMRERRRRYVPKHKSRRRGPKDANGRRGVCTE